MITYQTETYVDILPELKHLIPLHYDEIATDKDVIPLDPNHDTYITMEEEGMLHVCTARDDGQMIGYFITFVMNHLHYQTTMFGKVDVYFVHHDHRKNGVGLTLFKYHEDEMRRLGVKKLMNVCKLHKDHTPLFESLGYKKFEVVFAKLL
jgi:N-acetylglutamate synthase-like GNAT family acetyltransferase